MLCTDIVGYITLMEEDEEQVLSLLRKTERYNDLSSRNTMVNG
jgi:hypothetical protein